MKFGLHLLANLTPEWNSQYIQYEYMKELLNKVVAQAPVVIDDDDDRNSARERYFRRADDAFFEYCDKQLTKINTFFAEKLAEALRRFATLKDEIKYRESIYGDAASRKVLSVGIIQRRNKVTHSNNDTTLTTTRTPRPSLMMPLSRILPDRLVKNDDKENKRPTDHINTNSLKAAFSEYYLMLILLQKFQLLNFTGFRKILKKHDKLFETTRGEEWRTLNVDTATFYTSKSVTELILDVETIYTNAFESGDRPRAMKRLRVPPLEEKQSPIVTFRLGIFIGMICVLLPMVIILIAVLNTSQSGNALAWREALHLYRSSFLIILQITLAGINVYGWSSAGVNHILIFEIDPREHLTYQQLLEIGTYLCVLWCLSFITFIIQSYFDFYPFIQPLIFLVLMILFLINPFPILARPARYWLIRTLGLVVSAAFHRIRFADNWLCNQLSSVELAFFDLEFFCCFYFSDREWWSTNLSKPSSPTGTFCSSWTRFLLQAFLLALPSSLRFTQCVRRYYDTKQAYPHLVNAGKYSASLVVAMTNSLRRASIALNKYYSDNPTKNPFVYIWVMTALVNSTYKVIWDIKMDWGLFHKNAGENKFLRDHIIYSSKKYYYYAIIQDIVLRYSWTINIFIQFKSGLAEYSDVIGFSFGLVELIRRFSWNFFRLENEHLNNCGRYRAVRDISIKPITTGIDFTLIDSKLSREPGIRYRGRVTRLQTIIDDENMATTDDTTMNELETNIADFVKNQTATSNTLVVPDMNEISKTLTDIRSRTSHSFTDADDYCDSPNPNRFEHRATSV
ncbi:unnamed protein product [Adineta steineri]|uniref:Xenotropic and polytropic retrovirus receptor 1-like protein n=1 Tax=Adineta steineri TaxID=433720 RepID=A0A819R0B0_9BILA|nr:unnamed protein product [Adineta steineri]CAF4034306.1 unnamed protein product [Adineta steineri]